jgi:hypothetical protein
VQQLAQTDTPLEPQISAQAGERGTWFPAPPTDPVAGYIADHLWERLEPAQAWQVTPLLGAAYLYRETTTDWKIVAKFFVVKMGQEAQKWAEQELGCTQKARSLGLDGDRTRALRAHAAWRGVLFLEYVDGLTLQNMIAIRNSRLGEPRHSLAAVVHLLATLHHHGGEPSAQPDFASAADHERSLVAALHESGVLRHNPVVRDGALRLIDRWAVRPEMKDFEPAFIRNLHKSIRPRPGGRRLPRTRAFLSGGQYPAHRTQCVGARARPLRAGSRGTGTSRIMACRATAGESETVRQWRCLSQGPVSPG